MRSARQPGRVEIRMPALSRSASVALLAVFATAVQAQVPALTLTEPGPSFASAPYTLGFAFGVTEAVQLVSLGVYDDNGDGLSMAAQVALWQDGALQPLVQRTVAAGTAATLQGSFRFAPVAPLLLQPGTVYVLGAYLDDGVATSFGIEATGSVKVDTRIQLLGDRFGDGFFELVYPSQSDGWSGGWLGPNFQLAPVPEPSTAGLLAAGVALLAWRRRACHRHAGA